MSIFFQFEDNINSLHGFLNKNSSRGWEFPLEINSPVETNLYSETDKVDTNNKIKGKRGGQKVMVVQVRGRTEWTALVPDNCIYNTYLYSACILKHLRLNLYNIFLFSLTAM